MRAENWLFVGSPCAGKRAAAIITLIQSAKLKVYLKDILSRLPTQANSRVSELLPYRLLPNNQPEKQGGFAGHLRLLGYLGNEIA